MDLVTVYITTKDRAALLVRALDSVLRQDYKFIEIIVVDDGSIDSTPRLLEEYKRKFSLTVITNNASLGACVSRNFAIMSAKGVWITGLDDDDYFAFNRVSEFVKAADRNWSFDVSALYSDMLIKKRSSVKSKKMGNIADISALKKLNCIGSQVFTKTNYLQSLGGFDPEMVAWQDYEMWYRLVRRYGSAIKVRNRTYISDISHDMPRISTDFASRYESAHCFFLKKHGDDFSARERILFGLNLYEYPQISFDYTDLIRIIKSSSSISIRACRIFLKKMIKKRV